MISTRDSAAETRPDAVRVGLRVDVDTFRGTRHGVPRLLDLLADHGLRATFFFSVGPDNMGRHLMRLLRPAFAAKMWRSRAPGLYGWDIVLRGTLWPGPEIGARLGDVIRATAVAGHEVGLHAWDHHAWQTRLDRMGAGEIREAIDRGVQSLAETLGEAPTCSAAAAWMCNETVLREKEAQRFVYNSDCRGRSIFRPDIDGSLGTPQIPVTLPTYDEVVGRDGVTDADYNDRLLARLRRAALNVLTIHAEVEGIARSALFGAFLSEAKRRGIELCPLGALLPPLDDIPLGAIERSSVPGREGWISRQVVVPDA